MIPKVEFSFKLPVISDDFTAVLGEIGEYMMDSITMNFYQGGRPETWEPLKRTGEPSLLMQSGRLVSSLQMASNDTEAKVWIDTNAVPYAAIHNFGGVIKHPGSNKFQAFEWNGEMVFTWSTKPHDIPIPQRQFMMFQEEDKQWILSKLASAVFIEAERRTLG